MPEQSKHPDLYINTKSYCLFHLNQFHVGMIFKRKKKEKAFFFILPKGKHTQNWLFFLLDDFLK